MISLGHWLSSPAGMKKLSQVHCHDVMEVVVVATMMRTMPGLFAVPPSVIRQQFCNCYNLKLREKPKWQWLSFPSLMLLDSLSTCMVEIDLSLSLRGDILTTESHGLLITTGKELLVNLLLKYLYCFNTYSLDFWPQWFQNIDQEPSVIIWEKEERYIYIYINNHRLLTHKQQGMTNRQRH